MSSKSIALVSVASVLLGGCFPYDSHFICEKSTNYGKCTDVQGAYSDAMAGTGTGTGTASAPGDEKAPMAPVTKTKAKNVASSPVDNSALNRYKDNEYRAMAGLVDQPVAPVLAMPKVLRTLIVAYASDSALYMPRYVFYIADPSHFVMGDFLNQFPDPQPTLYPNGGP